MVVLCFHKLRDSGLVLGQPMAKALQHFNFLLNCLSLPKYVADTCYMMGMLYDACVMGPAGKLYMC